MSFKDILIKSVDEGINTGTLKPGGRIKQQLIDMMFDIAQKYDTGVMSLENKIVSYIYDESLDNIIDKHQSDYLVIYIENINKYLLVNVSNFIIFLENILPEDTDNYDRRITPEDIIVYEIILENIPQYAVFYYKNLHSSYIDQIKHILFDKIKAVTSERSIDISTSQLVTNIQINNYHEGSVLIEHINKLLGKSNINLSKILYTMPPLLTKSMKYKYTMNRLPIIPYNDIKHASKFMITTNAYNKEESVICIGNGNFTIYNNHVVAPNDIATRMKETIDKWVTDNPPGADESLSSYRTRMSAANRGFKITYTIINEVMEAKGYIRVKPGTHFVWRRS